MRKNILTAILLITLFALASCGGSGSNGGENGVVKIYSLGDYIDPDLIDEFEEATGYSVVMDSFDTNEEMYPVIKNNSVSYDVICVSDYMIERLISEDLLQEYNAENIPNLKYLMGDVKPFIESYDPGMKYSVPHTWGTYGILYNPELLAELGIDEGTLSHWETALWNPEASGQIIMPNSIREAYMIAAKVFGLSINSTDASEIDAMTERLIAQKPLVYRYDNDGVRDYLINESAALGVVNSGEVLYSKSYNEKLEYIVPDEGTELWVDAWAIPKAAENKEGAEAWINFMYEKESAALNFDYLTYAIPNSQIGDLLDDPVLQPSEEILRNSETLKNLGAEVDALYSEGWKKVKG